MRGCSQHWNMLHEVLQDLVRVEDRQVGILDIFELSSDEMRVSLEGFLSIVKRVDHLIGDLELISVVSVILIGGLFERKESVVDLVPRDEDPKKRKGEGKIDNHFDSKA